MSSPKFWLLSIGHLNWYVCFRKSITIKFAQLEQFWIDFFFWIICMVATFIYDDLKWFIKRICIFVFDIKCSLIHPVYVHSDCKSFTKNLKTNKCWKFNTPRDSSVNQITLNWIQFIAQILTLIPRAKGEEKKMQKSGCGVKFTWKPLQKISLRWISVRTTQIVNFITSVN